MSIVINNLSCPSHELKALVVKACRPPTGGISPSPHAEAQFEIEELMRDIESSSRNDQAKLKEACLRRDGFRCAITGGPDSVSTQEGRIPQEAGVYPVFTECSHVLPFMLRKFDDDKPQEVRSNSSHSLGFVKFYIVSC